jgi:hypothetical protein
MDLVKTIWSVIKKQKKKGKKKSTTEQARCLVHQ